MEKKKERKKAWRRRKKERKKEKSMEKKEKKKERKKESMEKKKERKEAWKGIKKKKHRKKKKESNKIWNKEGNEKISWKEKNWKIIRSHYARLDFELAYYDIVVWNVSHYTMGTSSNNINGLQQIITNKDQCIYCFQNNIQLLYQEFGWSRNDLLYKCRFFKIIILS